MGRSQLKVSTGTCSGPVQVAGSGCSMGGRSTKPGSREVTNSKCKRHFKDTVVGGVGGGWGEIKAEALEARSKSQRQDVVSKLENKNETLYSGRAGKSWGREPGLRISLKKSNVLSLET